MQTIKRHIILKYTLFGILFGFLFPILATLGEIVTHQLDYSWPTIAAIHQDPLILIIDSAPFFLGIFAFASGTRQNKLVQHTEHMEDLVNNRSKEIIRQKLFYEALVDNSPIAIVTLDHDHKIISINPAFQKLFGYRQDEIMSKDLDGLIANPEHSDETYKITQKVWHGEAVHEFGKRKCKDGSLVDVEIFGEQIKVNGNRIGVLGLYRDITAEKKAREALSASEERFRCMFSDSPVALRMEDYSLAKAWIDKNLDKDDTLMDYQKEHPKFFTKLDSKVKIIDLNEASLWLFGAKNRKELEGKLHKLIDPGCIEEIFKIFDAFRRGETTVERELEFIRLDGKRIYTITKLSIIPGYEQSWGRILFSNMDITERKMAEERLTYISLHDIMTGIYNRAFFEEEMSRLSKSRISPISILVMDMDNLKAINDQYGHAAGDIALQTVADIVKNCFRTEDVAARIGGDEIAVLLQGLDEEGAQKGKERILQGIRDHNQLNNNLSMALSLSVGCATTSQGNKDLGEVFKIADTRMYEEKRRKKRRKLHSK